jgi:ANTAR domain
VTPDSVAFGPSFSSLDGVTRVHPQAGTDGHRPPASDGLSDSVTQLRRDYEDLQHRLESLPVIEQAKGILIGRFNIDADIAFGILRRWSSHTNVKLREICRLLVDTAAHPPDDPKAVSRTRGDSSALEQLIALLNSGCRPEPFTATGGRPHRKDRST